MNDHSKEQVLVDTDQMEFTMCRNVPCQNDDMSALRFDGHRKLCSVKFHRLWEVESAGESLVNSYR